MCTVKLSCSWSIKECIISWPFKSLKSVECLYDHKAHYWLFNNYDLIDPEYYPQFLLLHVHYNLKQLMSYLQSGDISHKHNENFVVIMLRTLEFCSFKRNRSRTISFYGWIGSSSTMWNYMASMLISHGNNFPFYFCCMRLLEDWEVPCSWN